jgi:transposase
MVHHLVMKAYSVDLREKIVAIVGRGMSKAQAARTFGVGATSVKRYAKLAKEGKPLSPGKAPGKKGKLDASAMKLLEDDLHARPTVTYERRTDLLCELLGVRVSKSTICRMVGRLGYTGKKDFEYCDHGVRDVSPVWSLTRKKRASCLSTDPSTYRAGVAEPPVGVVRDLIGARTPQVPSQSSCPSLLGRRAMKLVPLARGESDGLLNR